MPSRDKTYSNICVFSSCCWPPNSKNSFTHFPPQVKLALTSDQLIHVVLSNRICPMNLIQSMNIVIAEIFCACFLRQQTTKIKWIIGNVFLWFDQEITLTKSSLDCVANGSILIMSQLLVGCLRRARFFSSFSFVVAATAALSFIIYRFAWDVIERLGRRMTVISACGLCRIFGNVLHVGTRKYLSQDESNAKFIAFDYQVLVSPSSTVCRLQVVTNFSRLAESFP